MSTFLATGDLHPVDRSVLLPYATVMTNTIRQWQQHLRNGVKLICFTEDEVEKWLNRLKATINAMMFRFLYESTDELYVDRFASGFPHRYSLRLLCDEFKQAQAVKTIRQRRLEQKRLLLEDLRLRGHANERHLHQICMSHAEEVLLSTGSTKCFRLISVREIKSENTSSHRRQYVCNWERFSYRNTPALYSMHFEFDGEIDEAAAKHLALVLEEETSQHIKLRQLVMRIDQSSAAIHPKVLCRIIAGPVFINGFTQDDNPLQCALEELETAPISVCASRIIYEYIAAENEVEVRRLIDPHGNRISVLGQYAVNELSDECRERQATKVEKFLFAPHRVIQSLDDDWRRELHHEFVTTD